MDFGVIAVIFYNFNISLTRAAFQQTCEQKTQKMDSSQEAMTLKPLYSSYHSQAQSQNTGQTYGFLTNFFF
jgi:hypothetical protein